MDNIGCHSRGQSRFLKKLLIWYVTFSEMPAHESHDTCSDSCNRKYIADSDLTAYLLTRYHGIFNKFFNKRLNILFGYPRKDICNVFVQTLYSLLLTLQNLPWKIMKRV